MSQFTSTSSASSRRVVKKCTCSDVGVRYQRSSTLVSSSPFTRALYISGTALFSVQVKENGW
ncbi:hypothetical protein D9M70_345070 [compost metagenome]